MRKILTEKGTEKIFLIAIFLCACFLLLFNLDNQYLWQDEAETALLGVNILRFGLPIAYDGHMLISQEWGREFGSDYLWRWTPWLDKYLAALSIYLFGKNTFAARLPFALLGILNVLLTFILARFIFRSRNIGLISAALLVFSVPFLLFTRQCRYYSIMIFATLLTIYYFFSLIRKQKYAVIGFVISTTILFHSNYSSFFSTIICLFIGLLICYANLENFRKVGIACALTLAINFPFMIFFQILKKSKDIERLYSYKNNLIYYLESIHHFLFPFLLLGVFILFLFIEKKFYSKWKKENGRNFLFVSSFCLCYILLIAYLPWHFFRYIINLIPLFIILTASMIYAIIHTRKKWVLGTLLLVAAIHFYHPIGLWPRRHHYLNEKCNNLFSKYLYEITHDYNGPLETTITYLQNNAKNKNTVFVSYGDLVVKFYTDLDIFGGQSGIDLSGIEPPDWIFRRGFFSFTHKAIAKEYRKKNMAAVKAWLAEAPYKRIELVRMPDIFWENRPDPYVHLFKSPNFYFYAPNVEIYKKED